MRRNTASSGLSARCGSHSSRLSRTDAMEDDRAPLPNRQEPMTDHVSDDDLVLHYYGELPAAEDARVESHLGVCRDCQANHGRLQRVMAFVDGAPAVEAPSGFERIVWARLAPALEAPRRVWIR